MARMLQALKNLEARSAKTPGNGLLAHLAEKPPQREPQSATLVLPLAASVKSESVAKVEEALPHSARPVRRADVTRIPPVIESPRHAEVSSEDEAPAERPASDCAASKQQGFYGKQQCLPHLPGGRNPSSLERQVHRTLSDPVRSQPLVQLADRLRRDAEQTASKTLLFVGVGETSGAHDALLYAAALLAEKHGEQVLLVDADLARRSLSEGLEQGQAPGLAELLRGDGAMRERCQPMALPGLALLPAGRLRQVDLSAVRQRLEEVLQQAAQYHSLVLIHGGRSGDQAATALGRFADATYFVVQLGVVETSEAQAALRDFRAASARVLGCIAT